MDSPQRLELVRNMLSFFKGDRNLEYLTSPYLVTEFNSEVFNFKFGQYQDFSVDFRVIIDDGSLLTSEQNSSLLKVLKSWICIQTHPDVTSGKFYAASTAYNCTRRVLTLIDYFLLNAQYFKLSEHGLLNVTENDITQLLTQLASSSETSTSIYQWPRRLSSYLLSEINKADFRHLNEVIRQNPCLESDIPEMEDRMLTLSAEELLYARAWLWDRGYYKNHYQPTKTSVSYRHGIKTGDLAGLIYPNTLKGHTHKPHPNELQLDPVQRYWREYGAVDVRNEDDQASEREWLRYKCTIRSMGQLAEIGAPIPVNALKATNNSITQASLLLKTTKRYKTIPTPIVMDSLKEAIEFALGFGPEILDSAIAVISAANKQNMSCVTYSATYDIRPLISPKIRELGVRVWHLGSHMNNVERSSVHFDKPRPPSQEYFRRFRNSEGLYELIRVFFGAAEVCVGALMARRQKELIDLRSGKALDKSKMFLIFFNGKSGLGEMREKELRPIPPVAVKLIQMIESFHQRLHSLGLFSEHPQLFSYPGVHFGDERAPRSPKYNASINYFCDYIETPLDDHGCRYYLRQHQLRRFFALMFFWGNSFGGMDTLRWFLGHTDIEHLYHYITESVSGEVLLATKAHFGSELIRSNPDGVPQLADIVEQHFGTRQFSILDYDELEQFLEELLHEGIMEVYPIFLEGPEGKIYRIAIKIASKEEVI